MFRFNVFEAHGRHQSTLTSQRLTVGFFCLAWEHGSWAPVQLSVSVVEDTFQLRTIFYEEVDTIVLVFVHFATIPWLGAAAELILNSVPGH